MRGESRQNRHRSNADELMEGVGARLGRSSTRYGPAAVFTGPVRKWKKKWVHVSPSNNGGSSSNNSNSNHSQNHLSSNGTSNGNNGSHLVLFKWTPISQSQNNNNGNNTNNNSNDGNNSSSKDDAAAAPEEPPRRKFKYIPVFSSLGFHQFRCWDVIQSFYICVYVLLLSF